MEDGIKNRPTKKQHELLNFIERFIADHGYGPSYREIMNGCSYSSVATVALHVDNLMKKGHLRKKDHSARSLEVVDSGASSGTGGSNNNDREQWLVGIVENKFTAAEKNAGPEVSELESVVRALKTLGFDGAAKDFKERLDKLQRKNNKL